MPQSCSRRIIQLAWLLTLGTVSCAALAAPTDFDVRTVAAADTRPAIVLDDVAGAIFDRVKMQRTPGAPCFVLRHVSDFTARSVPGLADTHRPTAEQESL